MKNPDYGADPLPDLTLPNPIQNPAATLRDFFIGFLQQEYLSLKSYTPKMKGS